METLLPFLAFLQRSILYIFILVVLVRLLFAYLNVRRDKQALATAVPMVIGKTTSLEVVPLYEISSTLDNIQTGLGVSYLIKTDTATLLFDVGNNPQSISPSPLEQNMARLGIGLDQVDAIAISHLHFDHIGGMRWQWKRSFSLASKQIPMGSRPIFVPEAITYPGSHPILVESPTKISEGVATTGGIPYLYPFPAWLAIPQGIEQAIVVNVKGCGIVIIVGCGHMGLDSLVAHVKANFNVPIIGVIGGLHEGKADANALQPQFKLLQPLPLSVVAISPHDSAPAAVSAFQENFSAVYQPIQVGRAIHIP